MPLGLGNGCAAVNHNAPAGIGLSPGRRLIEGVVGALEHLHPNRVSLARISAAHRMLLVLLSDDFHQRNSYFRAGADCQAVTIEGDRGTDDDNPCLALQDG